MSNLKNLKIVKFLHKMGVYSVGETAAFPEEVAKRLVDNGLAEIVKHNRIKLEGREDKQMKPENREKEKYVTK